MGEHIINSRSSFSRELPTWQPPVIFPPCLNVRELDVTGREGLEWGGRNLLASLIHVGLCFVSRLRILPVTMLMLKSHPSNGNPTFACSALQRMHLHSFSIQPPDKLIQSNSDAFRYRNIICMRGITPCVCELCLFAVCIATVQRACGLCIATVHHICAYTCSTHVTW